ncbi:hypothetical protein ACYJW8_14230 [Frateuria aurantia]
MIRTRLTLSLCSLALAFASATALAQSAPPATPGPQGPQGADHGPGPQMPPPGGFQHFGHPGMGPDGGILRTLGELQHLYEQSGRSNELPALYNEVLAKTKNPMLRQAVYDRLAHAQLRPANVDAAIATLRKSLDEGLAAEARFGAEHHGPGPHGPQPPVAPTP